MRRSPLLTVVLMLFVTTSATFGQNNFWTFPEQYWDTDQFTPGNLPTSSYGYNGSPSDYAHAGIKDPYDEPVFFVIDGKVYDETSNSPHVMYNDSWDEIKGSSEVLIVPRPGTCDQFYIFQSSLEGNGLHDTHFPHFSEYKRDMGLAENSSGQTSFNMVLDASLIDEADWPEYANHGIDGIHFAATRLRADSARWLFVSNNQTVYRINVTCDGLQNTGWKYGLDPANSDEVWRS